MTDNDPSTRYPRNQLNAERDTTIQPPTPRFHASKDKINTLHSSIKNQVSGHISDWSVLNAEQAKALHSDAGIQFFRRDGKDYRKVNYVGAGYGDWVCLVTQGWLNRYNGKAAGGGAGTGSGSDSANADGRLAYRNDPDYQTPMPIDPTTVIDTARTDHQISLTLTNPDGEPMPDALYTVAINGQTLSGRFNDQGEAVVEFLPEG
ncbi:MAG: hypothetical protein P8X74_15480, partial [Reinekea sp.]